MLKEEKTSFEVIKEELENEHLKVSLLPGFGGKISSLIHKQSGTEFLKQPRVPVDQIDSPSYGDTFLPPHAFGFDECFPNITPEKYKLNGRIVDLPDHGEIWSRECKVRVSDDELILISTGVEINYRFEKRISLNANRVLITYTLVNNEKLPFQYIWSTHPLLAIDEGDQILLPEKNNELLVNWSSDDHLGEEGSHISWPLINKKRASDLSLVKARSSKVAAKLFAQSAGGRAGIYRSLSNETLVFSFDPKSIPFIGLWLCYGGWPDNENGGDYTIAIEPATAEFDSLNRAEKNGQATEIAAGESRTWNLEMRIENGKFKV